MLAHQAGDAQAFDMLLQEHRAPLINYLMRFARNRAIAEELAQDVFLRVYRSRNYQPAAKFRSWLYRIATNLALNWLRDFRVERAHIALDETPLYSRYSRPRDVRAPGATAEERLVAACRAAEVCAAVEALSERSRVAVVLHKYQQMEYVEIADVLGCSVPAVKSLLFRTYEILRERLAHLVPPNARS